MIDDSPDAGEALAEWLTLEGWLSESVSSVHMALARIERLRPDVVIVEPGLRLEDGVTLAARVRQRVGTSTWLIAITGYTRAGDALGHEPTLFDRTLIKPVDEAQLLAALAAARFHLTHRH
ncbi:response regulator [Mitsuaria sp. TWR114]|uniref:response regulator n=1 Tax=Mitsuaria sp. TWR114 TaxID=2601731 RepID=UPI00164A1A7B|nr:response regulator [Mitsuaria sp. TWR114]